VGRIKRTCLCHPRSVSGHPGHTLIISPSLGRDLVRSEREEQHAILELVNEVKRKLDAELRPDGYNVGFNAGEAAGQTGDAPARPCHPRFRGDVPDARGGNPSRVSGGHRIPIADGKGKFV